jgi:Ca2+/Na+ antiporter
VYIFFLNKLKFSLGRTRSLLWVVFLVEYLLVVFSFGKKECLKEYPIENKGINHPNIKRVRS